MDIAKAVVSALAVFAAQVIIFLAMVDVEIYVFYGWQGAYVLLWIVTYFFILLSSYLVSKNYYFKGSKINDPLREGLVLGLVMAIIAGLLLDLIGISGFFLGGAPGAYLGPSTLLILSLALIPAATVIAAIDAKAAKKKRFWFF